MTYFFIYDSPVWNVAFVYRSMTYIIIYATRLPTLVPQAAETNINIEKHRNKMVPEVFKESKDLRCSSIW